MDRVRTAIVGMGKIGRLRADVMERHGGYEVISTCDIISGFDYTDWKKCLDESKPEAVVICTANHVMADIICYAMDKGVHVFCEKPPGRSLADTLRMKQAFDAAKVTLKFGFNHRYHDSIIEAKTLIDSGLLGQSVFIRGVYGKAGSEVFNTNGAITLKCQGAVS